MPDGVTAVAPGAAATLASPPAMNRRTTTSPAYLSGLRLRSTASVMRGGEHAGKSSGSGDADKSSGSGDADESSGSGAAVSKDTVVSFLLIALWYASSVVNNQSSKILVSSLGAEVLTLMQLLISASCGALVLFLSNGLAPFGFGVASRAQLFDTCQLAAAFLAGVYSLNACFAFMHVSLAMVLRAAEPLTTLTLSALMLPASEQPPLRKALALLPVVLGCGLSALGAHGPTARALGVNFQ